MKGQGGRGHAFLATQRALTRRHFLANCGVGLGGMALAAMQDHANPLAPRRPYFAPKARNVIYLQQSNQLPGKGKSPSR